MAMAWKQLIMNKQPHLSPYLVYGLSRYFSTSTPYTLKAGIPEFLNGVGKGVETHVSKLETEIGDFQKLLVHRKMILKYTHKHRLGLWTS